MLYFSLANTQVLGSTIHWILTQAVRHIQSTAHWVPNQALPHNQITAEGEQTEEIRAFTSNELTNHIGEFFRVQKGSSYSTDSHWVSTSNISVIYLALQVIMCDLHQSNGKMVNPLGLVPAIDDAGFKLFESHAILRYLACAYPTIPDHWYPVDASKRAKIDSVLDWHHSNLRHGSASLVLNRVLAPALGRPLNPQAASEAEILLKSSLSNLETIWLAGNGKFLVGSYQPSIADLSLACEVMQLELLDRCDVDMLLGPYEKVKKWVERVKEATKPHFEEVHEMLYKASTKFGTKRLQAYSKGSVDDSSHRVSSKL